MFQKLFLFIFIVLSFSACSNKQKAENEYTENTQIEVNFKFAENSFAETAKEFSALEKIDVIADDVKAIYLYDIVLNDSAVLSQYKNLEYLLIENSTINDFSFLYSLQNLKSFHLSGCTAQEYHSIKKLPNKKNITEFSINYCQQCDIPFNDISFLKGFYNIEKLSLMGNDISDISALSDMKELKQLFLTDGNFSLDTLKPLYQLKNLERIQLSMTIIENLSQKDMEVFGNPFFTDANTITEID